jgi:hypothetical protein
VVAGYPGAVRMDPREYEHLAILTLRVLALAQVCVWTT